MAQIRKVCAITMASQWIVHTVALCTLLFNINDGDTRETTTLEDSEEVVTEPEERYAYLKGDRLPDEKYGSPDEMYRGTLKHVLKLFWTEKCHISEVRYQHKKLKTPLMDEKINKSFDRVNELMAECGDDILDTLRDNITSSERCEPIDPAKFEEMASIFKEARRYFEERIPSEGATKPMNIILREVRLADERLHEGYGIVKEMVKNTTILWS